MDGLLITAGLVVAAIETGGVISLILAIAVFFLFLENRSFQKQLRHLRQELLNLNQHVRQLGSVDSKQSATNNSQTEQTERIEPSPTTKANATAQIANDQVQAISTNTVKPSSTTVAVPASAPPKTAKTSKHSSSHPDWFSRIMQFATTGNLTVKAGVVVLFFGVAFLLKYAADNSLLPIEFRLSAVAVSAIGLLALGWFLRRKNTLYALILQGGAIGILYLTVYSAFKLYDVISIELGFILLVIIMASSIVLAIYQDAKALAFMGVGGGFLAPVVASTGQGSHIILFSYYAVLNFSILAISWFKSWRELNLLGFFMTFIIGVAWGVLQYRSEQFASTELFLILFFLLYVAISILHAIKQPPNLRGLVDATLLFGTPIIASSIQAVLVAPYEYGIAYSTFSLGLFYLGLSWLIKSRFGEQLKTMYEAFFAISVIFFTITIPLAFDNNWSSAAWAIEGAGVIWISLRQKRNLALSFGLIVSLGASLLYVLETVWQTQPNDIAFINANFIGGLMIAVSALFSAFFMYRNNQRLSPSFQGMDILLLIWGALWWFTSVWREIYDFIPEQLAMLALLAHLAISAMLFSFIEIRYHWSTLKHGRLTWLLLLVIMFVLSFDIQAHPFANHAAALWFINAYLFYRILFWLEQQHNEQLSNRVSLHIFAFWLFFGLIGYELQWLADRDYPNWLSETGLMFMLPFVVALYFIGRQRFWPFISNAKTYINSIGWPLVTLLILWHLSFNINSHGGAVMIGYLPILNLLDIMSILSFVLIWLWWQNQQRSNPLNIESWAYYLAGLVSFLVANAIILRALYHWFDIDYQLSSWLDSIVTQATLSISWSVLGFVIMSIAHKMQSRSLWLAGSALLALVVVKVFTLDLASTGTIARIISFIGVGGVLMLVGYLYPIPPQQDDKALQKKTVESGQ